MLITGRDNIMAISYIVLRHRLFLETKGIKFKGSPTSVYVRDLLKSKTKNKLKLLSEYEDWMESKEISFKRYT